MFLSDTFRLVYFEIPRTGSRSTSEALAELDPESPTVAARKEQEMADYHGFNLPQHAYDYRIVATHRNPYDRLWSFWKYRHRWGNPDVFKTVEWPEYLAWAVDPGSQPQITGANHDIPMMEMPNVHLVTHWLRFSHLGRDWRALCEELNLPPIEMQHINSSGAGGGFQSAYTAELAQAVYRRFKADFDRFGYAEDSWQAADADSAISHF